MNIFGGSDPFNATGSGGGGSGTGGDGSGTGVTDYPALTNKPLIAGVPLVGNLPLSSFGIKSNQAGQVKARFNNLTCTGFVANTAVRMFLREADSATLEPAPTTLWPQAAIDAGEDDYMPGFFAQGASEADDRIRENNCPGQVHRWRVAGNYAGKDIGNLGRLRCSIMNPDSGFSLSASLVVPSGITSDNITFEFSSVADSNSLGVGRGYQLWFETSFDDSGLIVTVNSIVRISEAIDSLRAAS